VTSLRVDVPYEMSSLASAEVHYKYCVCQEARSAYREGITEVSRGQTARVWKQRAGFHIDNHVIQLTGESTAVNAPQLLH
jgi:hypothetical protein